MTVLTFVLTAEQPLLMTSLQGQGDPNSSRSFDYIPGSVIRGALIGRYKQSSNTLDIRNVAVRRMFFDGATCFLHGYPYIEVAPEDYRRSLPLPRSWFREKTEDDLQDVRDLSVAPALRLKAVEDDSSEDTEGEALRWEPLNELKQPKAVGDGFCWQHAGRQPRRYVVEKQINIHNARDRRLGRAVEGSGAVFRYITIAPGQSFQAAIICPDEQMANNIKKLLEPPTLWIGGSRSAGYGQVRIGKIEYHTQWNEVGAAPTQRPATAGELHLTLLSDLIWRDSAGQYSGTLPVDTIATALGLSLSSLSDEKEQSFKATTQLGGFNRTWGLPLPQTLALAAGSNFVFKVDVQPDAGLVEALEVHGLGERRAEGFGRVAINWRPGQAQFGVEATTIWIENTADVASAPQGEAKRIAQLMAKRMMRQRLERELTDRVERYRIAPGVLTNTQLSRLRSAARRAHASGQMVLLKTLLQNLTQSTRRAYESARIGNEKLFTWLETRVNTPTTDWKNTRDVIVAGETVRADAFAMEYTLRLIMAVARLAVKETRDGW